MSRTAPALEQHYTIAACAKLLGVHPNTIRRAIREGRLAAYALSRQLVRIPASAAQRWLEAHRI